MPKFSDNLHEFLPADFSFTDFPSGARVVDVGCGGGRHMDELIQRGCEAVGVEPYPALVKELQGRGLNALEGPAEHLPLPDHSVDGIVCSVVLPYTDERLAVAEWARVLAPGGEVRASYHGLGYALRQLFYGYDLKNRFYGFRTLLNTAFYQLTGRRIPGWIGDTLCQTPRQLEKYYRRYGFRLMASPPNRTILGQPVFIFHRLESTKPLSSETPATPSSDEPATSYGCRG